MDGLMALPRGRPRHLALLITVAATGLCSHTVEGQPYFEVISSVPTGACTLSQNGTCFTDGPGQYAANERCAIRVLADVVITVHEFVSEYGFDSLVIGGSVFSGHIAGITDDDFYIDDDLGESIPAYFSLVQSVTITWTSDSAGSADGFLLCATAGTLPPTVSTTPSPSVPAPTSAPTSPLFMVLPTNRGAASSFERGRLFCNSQPLLGVTTETPNVLTGTGPAHVYVFVAHSDQTVTYSTCGSSFDTVLVVKEYPGRGTGTATLPLLTDAAEIVRLDDVVPAACGTNTFLAQVSVRLSAGIYAVVVEGAGLASGAYALSATCSGEHRGEVSIGGPVEGNTGSGRNTLGNTSPEHLYVFLVDAPGDYSFDLCNSTFDTFFRILNVETAEILQADDHGCPDLLQTRRTHYLDRGEYILVVEGFVDYTGQYQLRVSSAAGANAVYRGPATCGSVVQASVPTGFHRYFSFFASTPGYYHFGSCGEAGVEFELHTAAITGAAWVPGDGSLVYSNTVQRCPDYSVREVYVPTPTNYTLVFNSTSTLVGVTPNLTDFTNFTLVEDATVVCPKRNLGRLLCPPSRMVERFNEFSAFFARDPAAIYGSTRFGVNETNTVTLEAKSSLNLDVYPCLLDLNVPALRTSCCASRFRVSGTPSFGALSALPLQQWQPFCGSNEEPINRTIRLGPGVWEVAVTSPVGGLANASSGDFSFGFDCGGSVGTPQLQCNATIVSASVTGLAVHWFRVPVTGVYSIHVCNSGSPVSAVVHGSTVTPLTCAGLSCCNGTFSNLLLSEDSEIYVEIDGITGATVGLTCPQVSMWRAVGAGGVGAVQYLQPSNQWATVCEDSPDWTVQDADVACKTLGFAGGVNASIFRAALQFDVSRTNLIGNASCAGDESSLLDCGDATLSDPGSCVTSFPAVRCFNADLLDDTRQLSCGQAIQRVEALPRIFWGGGGTSAVTMRFDEPSAVVLSTCASESPTNLFLWRLAAANATSPVGLPTADGLLHMCDSGRCTIHDPTCGLKATLGGNAIPLQLPPGDYLAVAQFQDSESTAQQVLSVALSCTVPLAPNFLRIADAALSATSARGFVDAWNATTQAWHRLRDDPWTKQDAQVVCRQLGYAFGDNPEAPAIPFKNVSVQCTGQEADLSECPTVASGGHLTTAFVHCADRQGLTISNRSSLSSQDWWASLPQVMFVGQTYTTLPINVSIFGGALTSFSTGSPLLFSLEVAEGPRYTQDAGQFLVNPQLGELLAQPRLPGRVGLVLSARDYAGFSTIVYSREVVLLDRGFELDSSWRQAYLQWPDRVTIQTTVTVDGPAEVGWSNDRLFQNFSEVRFALDFLDSEPGKTFIDTGTGSFTLTGSIRGAFTAQLLAFATDGSLDVAFIPPVVVKHHTFQVLIPDTENPLFGPNGGGCLNGGTSIDAVLLDGHFTCLCDRTQWQGPNCNVAAASASREQASNDTARWSIAVVAVALVVAAFLAVKYRRNALAARRKQLLEHYIHVLSSPSQFPDDLDYEQAVHTARAPVLREVSKCAPHVTMHAERLSMEKIAQAARLARRHISGWLSRSPSTRTERAMQNSRTTDDHIAECNGALFIALDLDRQDLIPGLVNVGADASMKYPGTAKLVVSQLLTDRILDDTDDTVERSVNLAALDALLRAGTLEFDDALGQILRRRTEFVHLVNDDGQPVVFEVDGSESAEITVGTTCTLPAPHTRTSSDTVAASTKTILAKYAHRENEGYTTVSHIVRWCVKRMAEGGWRTADERGDTVIHRILVACQLGRLSEGVAMSLITDVLDIAPSLLLQENAKGLSPSKLAMLCQGCPKLEQTFTIVVFKHFQLTNPARPRYKSATALIHEVRDLRVPEEQEPERIVIKLMENEDSWSRELKIRDAVGASSSDVIGIAHAATLKAEVNFPCAIPIETCPNLDHEVKLQSTAELMAAFPFGIVMPMADRNLAEVIHSERLAEETLDVIRQVALRIATAIHGVHLVGVVHGDVKPRNIVRSGSNDFRLIDLDMSFAVQIMATTANSLSDHASGQVPSARTFDLAPKGKIRASSAYCCPELIQYVASESERARETTEAALGSPFRIDVWSFGVTLYEIATGLALFENQYDRLTPMGEALLVNWTGLTDSHVATIVQLYGASESASLIDALKWLLDPIASHRPADMADVLAHVFFNPKHGAMREHAAVDHIRTLLENRTSGERPCKRVFVSYCWADSTFVLNRLAQALAPVVESLWLDRLGGDTGMGEWTRASMERGVADSDVVIAVVTPSYIKSRACGFEMGYAHQYRKPLVPLKIGIPYTEWPPEKIGETGMIDQFQSPTGDMKLYIDFTDAESFSLRFNTELLPRISWTEKEKRAVKAAATRWRRRPLGGSLRTKGTPAPTFLDQVDRAAGSGVGYRTVETDDCGDTAAALGGYLTMESDEATEENALEVEDPVLEINNVPLKSAVENDLTLPHRIEGDPRVPVVNQVIELMETTEI